MPDCVAGGPLVEIREQFVIYKFLDPRDTVLRTQIEADMNNLMKERAKKLKEACDSKDKPKRLREFKKRHEDLM